MYPLRTISCAGSHVLFSGNVAAAVLASDVARVSGKAHHLCCYCSQTGINLPFPFLNLRTRFIFRDREALVLLLCNAGCEELTHHILHCTST
ncbi:hypothetical protein M440DRAFT_339255 [Trichoderma longibrachiatum ATCC 18648]|uniref:Uncharacterized protein n=1 Tax=Trichoderma longibrachiatum ATCC 18648 TaxID=983965 RepID=A0A2T4C0W4_TRILO|nr:hypothetical protein M440DRAFT_339255 [Trichoderma longibrachiatum ATCC 18648]